MNEYPDMPGLESVEYDRAWKTDSQGITAYGVFSNRRIEWHHVREVKTRWVNLWLGRRYVIKSADQAIIAPIKDIHLSASIWQHLRRVGKESGIELPEEAKALWEPVSEDVPHHITWMNPYAPTWLSVVLKNIIPLIAGVYLGLLLKRANHPILSYLIIIVCGYIIDTFGRNLITARSFTFSEDHFEAETLVRKISFCWEELQSVKWNSNQTRVELRKSFTNGVYLPWYDWDEESTQLIQAIARNLRSLPKPVQLPLPSAPMEEEE